MIRANNYINPVPMAQRKPREQLEIAARSVLEDFPRDWPWVENVLHGHPTNVATSEDGKTVTWTIKGFTAEMAEILTDRFAKGFQNALVGVLNVPNVVIIFEVGELPHE